MSRFEFEINCPLGDFLEPMSHMKRHEALGWRDTYCGGYLDESDLTDLLRFLLKDKTGGRGMNLAEEVAELARAVARIAELVELPQSAAVAKKVQLRVEASIPQQEVEGTPV